MIPYPVIAIDGPAGAGKSTVARALARRLEFFLLDTGAIYRSLALYAEQQGVSWADGPRLGALASTLPIRFGRGKEDGTVFLADQIVTTAIRTPEVSLGASQVSAHPEVRAMLLGLQRQLSRSGPCVVEGRDIGTVVLPDAPLKIFLTASPETGTLIRRNCKISVLCRSASAIRTGASRLTFAASRKPAISRPIFTAGL